MDRKTANKATRRTRLRPGLVIAFAAVALLLAGAHAVFDGVLSGLREKTYDAYQILMPVPLAVDQVAVVAIDEASLTKFGRWPWPRSRIADLVDAVSASGAVAIGLDMFLSEPQTGAGGAADDAALAEALSRAPSVLAVSLDASAGPLDVAQKAGWSVVGLDPAAADGVEGGVVPLTQFSEAASGLGIVRALPDADGTMRKVPLVWAEQPSGGDIRLWPAFALDLLRVAQGAESYTLRLEGMRSDAVRTGGATVLLGADGRIRLIDTTRPVPHVSAADLLDNGPSDALAGRIAIIAVDAAGLDQYHLTARGHHRLGADIHAIALTQMLDDNYLFEAAHARWTERGMFLAGAELLLLILAFLARRPLPAAVLAVPVVVAPAATGLAVYATRGLLIDGVQPSAGLALIGGAGGYALFREAERRRRALQRQFSQFLSPDVVRQLAETDAAAALEVENREITALLVDIRGFTAMTESLSAERTVAIVNRFLEIANREIFLRNGTIDKYMGDAVLVLWNAPMEIGDHADRAIECAQAIIAAVQEANADAAGQDMPRTEVAATVETGVCSVGNMGTERRIDYTAIGPAINIVSRLEAEAKRLGEPLLIGPGTAARARTPLREVATVNLRGIEEAVKVFAPRR